MPRTHPDAGPDADADRHADGRNDQTDRQYFADLAAGTPDALDALYDRYAAPLFRHALALCRKHADAEDLVQATFLKLATTRAELASVRSPAHYLHRTLHTTWIDGQRRMATDARAREETRMEVDAPAPSSEDAIDMARALDQLAVTQREAIVLHLVEGLSFREIGAATGVSLFTSAARYRLGLVRLRANLGPRGRGRA